MKIKKERAAVVDQLVKDYDDYHSLKMPPVAIEFSLSPLTTRSHGRGKSYSYGASIENMAESKNYYSLKYEYSHQSFNSKLPGNSYSFSQYNLNGKYIHNELWQSDLIKHISTLSFYREREQHLYPVKSQVRIGPMGLYFLLWKNSQKIKEISFTYIPVKEYYSYHAIRNNNYNEPITSNKSNWRHHLETFLSFEPYPHLILSENFIYRPTHKLFTGAYSHNDSDLLNIISLNYQIFPYFSLGYQNRYSRDIRRKESLGYPSTDTQNIIQLFYQFG